MRSIIIIIWLLLGLFYWKCQDTCCSDDGHRGVSPQVIPPVAPVKSIAPSIKKLTPIGFDCSSAVPNTDPEWVKFRDSLISNLKGNSLLEINGHYYNDENSDAKDNLGMERARNVLKLISKVGKDRVRLGSKVKGDSCLHSELNNLITFRYARNTEKIIEVDDKTIIYFPYGSSQKLNDAEVEAYLDEVVAKVKSSGESIRLIGHTDDEGSKEYNRRLGELRALTIQNYLIKKGLSPNKVIVMSSGENNPIANNYTEEGRAKNRRTELQIIK